MERTVESKSAWKRAYVCPKCNQVDEWNLDAVIDHLIPRTTWKRGVDPCPNCGQFHRAAYYEEKVVRVVFVKSTQKKPFLKVFRVNETKNTYYYEEMWPDGTIKEIRPIKPLPALCEKEPDK